MDNNTPLGDSELQTLSLESNSSAVNYHAWLCEMACLTWAMPARAGKWSG